MLLPAKVAHATFNLTDGAVRRTLSFGPALRRYMDLSETVVVSETARKPAAVNARSAQGGAMIAPSLDSHKD